MERKSYYRILGVSRQESPRALRAAFRDRAKQLHPDVAGEPSTQAFQELAEAYRVLSDPERRVEYDRELSSESGGPPDVAARRAPIREPSTRTPASILGNPEGIRPSFEAMLERFLRNFTGIGVPKSERTEPLNFEVILTREEAASGCVVPVGVPVFGACTQCHGTGHDWGFPCERCRQTGILQHDEPVEIEIPAGVPSGSVFAVSLEELGIQNFYLCLHVFVEK